MQGRKWVFLAPCSNPAAQKHFRDTILDGVRFADIEEYLEESDKAVLRDRDPLRLWGNVPGKHKGWDDMEVGDFVLFYQRGKFTHAGEVYYITDNVRLSRKLWPDYKEGKPWRYIYFLNELKEIEIPLSIVRDYSRYKAGFVPMGFTTLRSEAIDAIVENHGSIEAFVRDFGEHEETAYFVLITGGGEYKDEPRTRYHFKEGIPGSRQLRDAENSGKFVYYEKGRFYAKGDVGKITSYEEGGVTYYYAKVENFEEIGPFDLEQIKSNLSFSNVGQAGITRILEEDYNTIVTWESEPTFAFSEKDFESCTGRKDDARYLNERFKELLGVLRNTLDDRFANYKSYPARPSVQPKRGQKRARWRDHMWLGFAHPKFERPQGGIQFQVVINARDPFYMDIWIDRRAPLARELAKKNIERNREAFRKSLRSLTGFEIGLYEGHELEHPITELDEETITEFIDNIPTYNTHVHIGKKLSQEEVLSQGPKIVKTIVDTFDELYPTYLLLVGEQMPEEAKLSAVDRFTIAHLITGRNVIFYGPPGTGKTRKAVQIAKFFCGDRDNGISFETANAEWTAYNVVGGPTLSGEGELSFKPGFLTWAAIQCSDSIKSSGLPHFLIIDEINRANLDLAFGKIFSLLDIEYRNQAILGESDLSGMKNADEYQDTRIPLEFRILATMNTYDTALLFSLGYAFRRRFAFVEIGSPFTEEPEEKYEPNEEQWRKLEIQANDRINDLAEETKRWISSATFLQPSTSLKQKLQLSEEFDLARTLQSLNERMQTGEFDPINPYKLACSLSEMMTRDGVIEAGYAQAVDIVKYALIYAAIFSKDGEKDDLVRAMDEAVKAYFIPQVQYYLPRARRTITIGKKEEAEAAIGKLEALQKQLADLGLAKASNKVKAIISRLTAGEISLF